MSCTHSGQICFDSRCLQGQGYTDAGATAYDDVDGAVNAVTTTGLTLLNTMVVRHHQAATILGFVLHAHVSFACDAKAEACLTICHNIVHCQQMQSCRLHDMAHALGTQQPA